MVDSAQAQQELRRREAVKELDRRKASGGFSQLQTGVEQVGEGLTGGFYDRIPAAISATMRSGANAADNALGNKPKFSTENGSDWSDFYKQDLAGGRKQMETRQDANPITAGAGYIGGAMASPINKLGLPATAVAHGMGNTEDIDPIEKPGTYAWEAGIRSAINMAVPFAAKTLGAAGGRLLQDTAVARGAGKVADKLGGYIDPAKLRLAKLLQNKVPASEVTEATNRAAGAAKYGAGDLPLAATGGEELKGFARTAASQEGAADVLRTAGAKLKDTFGTTSKKTGENFSKGTFGNAVSKMYDDLAPVAISKAGFKQLLGQNPGAAKYIKKAQVEALENKTGANPTSYQIIKNARDLMNKDNISAGTQKSLKEQFGRITENAYKEADAAFALLNKTRQASGGVRNQIANTVQKARNTETRVAETSPVLAKAAKVVGSSARTGAAALGIGTQKLESIVAQNPKAQKMLADLLLNQPTTSSLKTIAETNPKLLNKLLEQGSGSGMVGVASRSTRKDRK